MQKVTRIKKRLTKQMKQRLPMVNQLVEKEFQSIRTKGWSVRKVTSWKFRLQHKFLGLCRHCNRKIAKRSISQCNVHLKVNAEDHLKVVRAGKCERCRIILSPEYDMNTNLCSSCYPKQQNPLTRRGIYNYAIN